MPKPLREWAERKGFSKLIARYGWAFCEVCGRIGIRWGAGRLPAGVNLEFEIPRHGWFHPPADAMNEGDVDFGSFWNAVIKESTESGETIEQLFDDHGMASLFDKFMRALTNSWGLIFSPELLRGKGVTNPWDFCMAFGGPLFQRQKRGREFCPRCGEPGTGAGVVGKERRFFHEANRTCYLGMVNPTRKEAPEVTCPKCGEQGRKSISKGYAYIRHKNKTCYVGKLSDELA